MEWSDDPDSEDEDELVGVAGKLSRHSSTQKSKKQVSIQTKEVDHEEEESSKTKDNVDIMAQQFNFIASKYEFRINRRQCRALANILLKNYSVFITPRSSKEVKLKELKLNE